MSRGSLSKLSYDRIRHSVISTPFFEITEGSDLQSAATETLRQIERLDHSCESFSNPIKQIIRELREVTERLLEDGKREEFFLGNQPVKQNDSNGGYKWKSRDVKKEMQSFGTSRKPLIMYNRKTRKST